MSATLHDVVDPATEQVIGSVPSATIEDTDAAIVRAASAFESWRAVAPADRGRLLRRVADAVDGANEELAARTIAASVSSVVAGGTEPVTCSVAGSTTSCRVALT